MNIRRTRNKIRDDALRIIQYMTEWPKLHVDDARRDWLAPPTMEQFSYLEPLGFEGFKEEDDPDWFIFHPEDCPPDLVWPLNVGFVVMKDGDEPTQFSRYTTVTARQARGYASRFGPYMIRGDHGMIDRGKLVTAAGLWVWLGGRWTSAQSRRLYSDAGIPDQEGTTTIREGMNINMGIALALRQRYEWAVALSLDNSPSIRFATDATGIKAVYKVRDIPEGRDRRDALMTWITDHWRQTRPDAEVETYVRKHLRGAIKFGWRGLQAEVIPAAYDVEQRDKLIGDREAMRLAGTDKRPLTRS